jgi:hypothetical protein
MTGDYHFPHHTGWVGLPQPSADHWIAFGTQQTSEEKGEPNRLDVRLSDALRFTGADGVLRDLPTGVTVTFPEDRVTSAGPFGGTFAELMIPYLVKTKRAQDEQNARSVLPPPLHREGERIQPNWLYGFLRNPEVIRPEGYMLLRMPKFNMSGDEATMLVDYFTAAARLNNPGAGVTAQYLNVEQREPDFWQRLTREYVQGIKQQEETLKGIVAKLDQLGKKIADEKDPTKKKALEEERATLEKEHPNAKEELARIEARPKEMEQAWEQDLKVRIADAEAGLGAAKKAVEDTKDAALKADKEKELANREAAIKKWKEQLEKKDFKDLRAEWDAKDAYATDAFRSITNKNLCLQCHDIGKITIQGPKGPNLALTAARLRPEWVKLWTANPKRMFPYEPIMPQNFPNDEAAIQQLKLPFVGTLATPEKIVEASRDVLMDLPRLSELPGTRILAPVATPAGGAK